MNKPKVGDILCSLNVGNAARHKEPELTPVVVTKVGRKYFYCCPKGEKSHKWMITPYYLADWREKSDYTASSHLYLNPQQWEDEKKALRICKKIESAFKYGGNHWNISLDNLRKIEQIIEKAKCH